MNDLDKIREGARCRTSVIWFRKQIESLANRLEATTTALSTVTTQLAERERKLKLIEKDVDDGLKSEMGDGYVAAFAQMLKRILTGEVK